MVLIGKHLFIYFTGAPKNWTQEKQTRRVKFGTPFLTNQKASGATPWYRINLQNTTETQI